MKAGKSISELAQHVSDLRTQVRDFKVAGSVLEMGNDLNLRTRANVCSVKLDIAPNRIMHEQIAERLGIPSRYYQKMQTETPELLARNVNEWLTRGNGEKRFVRTYAESEGAPLTGRAFLGSTYRPLDNYDLIAALVPPMQAAGVKIVSSEVTDKRLYIQAVAQDFKSKVVIPGTHNRIDDVLNIGLIASNSEVGNGALSIRALVFRQVCSNGLVISEDLPGFKQVHIGRGDDSEEQHLSADTKKLRDAAIWSRASDVIKAAISQATLDRVTAKLNAAAGIKLPDPEKAIELIVEKYDLAADERTQVMKNLIEGGDTSLWGLTNAVTAIANTASNYDRAVELEEIGGRIVALPASTFGNN